MKLLAILAVWMILAQQVLAAEQDRGADVATRDGKQTVAGYWSGIQDSLTHWTTEKAVPTMGSLSARLLLATLLGGVGLWLMLPSASRRKKRLGIISALAGACVLIGVLPTMAMGIQTILFWMLAGVTVGAAAATVTSRSPVYSAIWFAMMLLGTGGLFMIQGAQFLGVATVAVYAGAIVVTFLFVLMLAQPEGHSFYDRISWGKIPSLLGCIAGVGLATVLIGAVAQTPLDQLATTTSPVRTVLEEQHVARLGGRLFSRHLVAVQLVASLLMAALVGAIAMVAQAGELKRYQPVRQTPSGTTPSDDSADSLSNPEGSLR